MLGGGGERLREDCCYERVKKQKRNEKTNEKKKSVGKHSSLREFNLENRVQYSIK